MMKRLTALLLALAMLLSVMPGMTLGVTAEGEGASASAMPAAPEGHDHTSHDGWTAWPTDGSVPTSGKYYLTAEVTTLSAAWAVNGDFMLCLNGKELKASSGIKTTRASGGAFTICDCTASYSTEGVYTAGKITGARINIARNTKLNLCDGILTGSSVGSNGAAVYLGQGDKGDGLAGAVFNMYDGMITDNHATGSQHGGAVAVGGIGGTGDKTPAPGQFNMAGGTISNNSAGGNGGAIYTLGGGAVVNIYGGTIEKNTATGNGGAVNASSDSQIHVSNVLIRRNQAKQGGGINAAATASLTVSGSVVIAGNTASGAASNIYLGVSDTNRCMVAIGAEGLTEDAWIGVGMYSPRAFTTALGGKEYTANFFSDKADYSVALESDALTLITEVTPHTHCICGKDGCTEHGGEVTFKAWNDPYSLPTGGDYVLMTDVTLDQKYSLGNTNLCLNGHTVTQTAEGERHIIVNQGATVSITDCSATPGGFTADKEIGANIIGVSRTGTLNLWNGKLYGNTSAEGGAVNVNQAQGTQKGGVFNMYGGEISGNTATNAAGAIIIPGHHETNYDPTVPYAEFNMYGGKITGNTATNDGGAIYAYREAKINLVGGIIEGNTAGRNGGGIYVDTVSTVTVSGTIMITGNTSTNIHLGYSSKTNAGGMVAVGAEGLADTAKIGISMPETRAEKKPVFTPALGGKDYTTNFFSDNSNYTVALENDQLVYRWGHSHCICGTAGCTSTEPGHEAVNFKPWGNTDAEKTSLPDSGNYYLVADVTLTEQRRVEGGDTLNLCLHGQTVTQTVAGQKHIEVGGGATVSITDCEEEMGGFTSTVEANMAAITVARNGGVLNLWNGKIYGNTGKEGGAVSVFQAQGSQKGAVFNMYGGEISGNKTTNVAGAVMISGHHETDYDPTVPYSAFNMYGGKISGNTAANDGGAIYAHREAIVNLYGGIIENNQAVDSRGGAVFATTGSQLNIENAVIHGNTAGTTGGGISADNSTTVTIGGATQITGNTSTTNGGGIYVEGGCAVSVGGTTQITGNIATGNGGGIYATESSTIALSGAVQIKENRASASGGGIHAASSVELTVSGTPVIQNNTIDSGASNLQLVFSSAAGKGAMITVGAEGLTENAKIGVCMSDTRALQIPEFTTKLNGKDYTANFSSDFDDYIVVLKDDQLIIKADHSHCICGVEGCTSTAEGHVEVGFIAWGNTEKEKTSLPTSGNYYLVADIVVNKQYDMNTVNLCLNGHTITQTKAGNRIIYINSNQTVSITDCSKTPGGLTSTVTEGGASLIGVRNTATLNLWNGKLYGNTKNGEGVAVYVNEAKDSNQGATFNMYGGEISGNSGNNGAAIMISGHNADSYDATLPYSAFNMYGGKISGNTAAINGGAIYGQREAVINLQGGIIENNTAVGYGGAVYASKSTVTIGKKMQISGNTAENAGGVYAGGGTQLAVSGKITGNTATVNGGGLYSTGAETVITVSGGEISGNKAINAGGGAIVETKSTFNLTGGTITGNTAAYGGGIYVNNSAKLNMTGGTVSKNSSEKTGGGIYMIGSSTGVLSGGKILENAAGTNGGGMYITGNGTTATLNGVTIQKNTATGKGGGVYIYTSAEKLTLSGNTVISSNKADGKTSNLHLAGERIMELGTMGEKAKVGITVDGMVRVISNTIQTDYSANFTSDLSSRKVVYLNNVLQLQVSSDHQHCLCAAEVKACDHSAVVWEAWTDKTSLPTGGNYYLTVDVQMTKAIEVSEDLNLCLNGHTVKAGKNTYHIQVAQGGKLSITDCAKTTGKLTGGNRSGSGGSVRVARGAEFNLYKGKLTGNKATTDGGAVYVWMGTKEGDGGVFNMYGGLIYENSAVNGGGVSIGGASDGAKPGTFTLSGGTIRNNSSTSGGGGIYIGDGGQFTMTDGIVKENSSKYGGGIYLNGATATLSGGYVKANAAKYQVTVKDGKEEKSGGNGGGVYIRASEATLSGVLIYENTADAAGGGVCTARITSTVNGETVSRVSTVTMTGGKIYKNSATHAGGILVQSMATFTMKDGSVYSNTASSSNGGSGNGGGFYVNNAILNVEGGTIETNSAVSYGGGIYGENKAQLNITGGEILSNTAKYGAGVAQKQSTAVLSGGTITKNTASGNGGGLYVRAAETKLSGIVITANTAKGNGGGICTARVTETVDGVEKEYASTIEMTGGEVSKNKAASGGGMFIQSKAVFTLKDGTVTGNTSTKNGGGAYVSADSVLNMEGGKIDGNKGVHGAGIYNYRGTANLSGGAVSNNAASKNGGGVYASGSEVNLTGVTISGNSAKTNGGGLTTAKATVTTNGVKKEHSSKITMTGGKITGNTAGSNAGGILVQSKAVFKLSGGTISGNEAKTNGGGMFVSTDSSLQMTGGTVSKNHAERHGGGIYMMRSENTIKNATITGNTSVKNGSALYLVGADLTIANTKITDNVAEGAGALTTAKATISTDFGYNEYRYSTLTMTDCTFSGNRAATAGAMVLQSDAVADISNTTFTGNAATGSAGALYIGSGEVTLTDVVFEKNTAGKQGGAIESGSNESNTVMIRCSFTGNTAATNGGAIRCRSNMELIDCTITGNTAGELGGGIGTGKQGTRSNYQGGLTVRNSTIDGNTAGTQGGGLYLILGIKGAIYDTAITNNKAGAEGGAIWAVDDLTMDGLKATGNTSGGNGYAVWLDDANFDGHSYFTGRMKLGGNAQITDNEGGDLYMGKEVVIAMTSAGLGKDAKINVTLDSGLLTNRVYGAYNYEGGDCVYTVTYGDRSLTEPEYAEPVAEETEPTEGTEGTTAATEPKAENTLLYAGVGAFAVVIAAIAVIVVLLNKKKKAGKTATEVSQD